MELLGFVFKEDGWEFDFSSFQSVNLLVGKNASGKSRVVSAIDRVAGILTDREQIPVYLDIDVSILLMTSENNRLKYSFSIERGRIKSEQLIENDNQLIIDRSRNSAVMVNEPINPPSDKLLVQIRRDTKRFPEIEQLIGWANSVSMVSFTQFEQFVPYVRPGVRINQYDLYDIVKDLTKSSLEEFYAIAVKVGFNIKRVRLISEVQMVFFQEDGVKPMLTTHSMSNGMTRALSLLLYMIYFKQVGYPALILVDDLCEGLDYDHSVRLGKEVFLYCEQNNIQLIATSNDAFLMDIVDINRWCVLRRNGGKIKVLNRHANQQLFDDFQMTGLSNFDFFASDYIDKHLEQTS